MAQDVFIVPTSGTLEYKIDGEVKYQISGSDDDLIISGSGNTILLKNVGIGTNNPTQKLEVNGKYITTGAAGSAGDINTNSAGIYSYRTSGRYIRFNSNGGANDFLSAGAKLVVNWSGGQDVEYFGSNDATVFINGNLSLGGGQYDTIKAPTKTFTVIAGLNQGSTELLDITDHSQSIHYLHISSNGNVGIGTTIPEEQLHVWNNVSASAYYGDGSNLTGISGSTSASFADYAMSASHALKTDLADSASSSVWSATALSSSHAVKADLADSASSAVWSATSLSASHAAKTDLADSASSAVWSATALSSSHALLSDSASSTVWSALALSSSHALLSDSASSSVWSATALSSSHAAKTDLADSASSAVWSATALSSSHAIIADTSLIAVNAYWTASGGAIHRLSDVGIGTDTPSNTLHVWGDISGSGFFASASGQVGIGTVPTYPLHVYASGSTVFSVEGSQGTLFQVRDSFVGTLFEVNDISGIPILYVEDTDTVVAGTYGKYTLYVTGSLVGIGTSTPAFTNTSSLHVWNEVSASKYYGDGSNLTGISGSTSASFADYAMSASHALKTDLADSASSSVWSATALSASHAAKTDLADSASSAVWSAAALSASHAVKTDLADSASSAVWSATALSASHALLSDSASSAVWAATALSASYALLSDSASSAIWSAAALSASYAANSYWSASGGDIHRIGNVGIGTTNPVDTLHVWGTISASAYNQIGTTDNYFGGDVGIGTTSLDVNLHIYDPGDPRIKFDNGGTDWVMGVDDDQDNRFSINLGTSVDGPAKFSMLQNGNVGLGTTDPSEKLEVHGNLLVTGSISGSTFYGDGANVTGVISASHALVADSVNGTITSASFADYAMSASHALKTDLADSASSAVWAATALSASHALLSDSASSAIWSAAALSASYAANSYWSASGGDIHRIGNVGIGTTAPVADLHVWGTISASAILADISSSAPSPSTDMVLTETSDYITIEFSASATPGIDTYELWRAQASETSSYSLIGLVKEDSVSAAMALVDNSYTITGSLYYSIYAMKGGQRSTALSDNLTTTASLADVTNLDVVAMTHHYFIQYDVPNDRRFSSVTIKKDADAVEANLDEASATAIYSGRNGIYMYEIPIADLEKYHQFWVYTVANT